MTRSYSCMSSVVCVIAWASRGGFESEWILTSPKKDTKFRLKAELLNFNILLIQYINFLKC